MWLGTWGLAVWFVEIVFSLQLHICKKHLILATITIEAFKSDIDNHSVMCGQLLIMKWAAIPNPIIMVENPYAVYGCKRCILAILNAVCMHILVANKHI